MTILTARFGTALELAAAHHDLLTSEMLRQSGVSRDQAAELCRNRVLDRIVRGLYRRWGTRSPAQDAMAATMRHRGSVASHTTALFLHGFEVEPPDPPHITLPADCTSRSTLATLHRSPLDPVDRTHRQRIPVTALPRSIVDAAVLLPERELALILNDAVARRMVTLAQIEEAADRVEAAPGRTGSGRMRSVLAPWHDRILPDSAAEAAAIRRIGDFGLPLPETQFVIEDRGGNFVARVDLAWPVDRVVREYDSDRFHGPEQIERDEKRRQRIEALGWTVGVLNRHDLRPGQEHWLRTLARDLHR